MKCPSSLAKAADSTGKICSDSVILSNSKSKASAIFLKSGNSRSPFSGEVPKNREFKTRLSVPNSQIALIVDNYHDCPR